MQVEPNVNIEKEVVITDGAVLNAALGGEALFTNEFASGRGLDDSFIIFSRIAPDPYSPFEFDRTVVDVVYSASMIARRAVEILPEKAFRLLKSWESPDTENDKGVNKLMQIWNKLIVSQVIEAGQMARKYQDAYLLLFFDDTDDLSQPLDTSVATRLVGALARSRWSVNPVQGYPGTAEYYTVTHNYGESVDLLKDSSLKNVHRSRIIHIPGLLVDDEQKKLRQGYNMSIFSYLVEPLAKWICSNHSGIDMLQSHSAFTLGLEGLAWKTSNKDISSLHKRFSSILSGLKKVGGLFYDKGMEEAKFISRSYSGVDALIEQLEKYLLNASDIPKEFLMNSSESAYSAEGLGSRYALAGLVETYQATHVSPIVDRLFPLLAQVYGIELSDDEIFYEPVYGSALILTRGEEADIRFKNAQADSIYLNAATNDDEVVLNSASVRTRWESGHYSDDITLKGDFKKQEPTPVEGAGSVGKEIAKQATRSEKPSYTTQEGK